MGHHVNALIPALNEEALAIRVDRASKIRFKVVIKLEQVTSSTEKFKVTRKKAKVK